MRTAEEFRNSKIEVYEMQTWQIDKYLEDYLLPEMMEVKARGKTSGLFAIMSKTKNTSNIVKNIDAINNRLKELGYFTLVTKGTYLGPIITIDWSGKDPNFLWFIRNKIKHWAYVLKYA